MSDNQEGRSLIAANASTAMGEVAPRFDTMAQVMEFGRVMSTAGIAVRKHMRNNPGVCTAIAMQAMRWEMDPFTVGNKSFEVNDQIAYESQLIVAVINTRAPIKGRLKTRFEGEGTARTCVASAVFIGEDAPTEVRSPPIGQIHPKNSPLWKSDPDQQLAYYTKRLWARRECPEVMLGVYDPEELSAPQTVAAPRPTRAEFVEANTPAVDVTFVDVPVSLQPEPDFLALDDAARVVAAQGTEAFRTWWKTLAKGARDGLRSRVAAYQGIALEADTEAASALPDDIENFDGEPPAEPSALDDVVMDVATAEPAPMIGLDQCRELWRWLREKVESAGKPVELDLLERTPNYKDAYNAVVVAGLSTAPKIDAMIAERRAELSGKAGK